MPTLADIRAKHPEYHDLSDQQLADGIYKKFYSDVPREQFDAKIGYTAHEPYSGGILPFSKDANGHVSFDSNAGLLGSIKRSLTLPGEVYQGKVDPLSDEGIGRATEMGSLLTPVNPAFRAGDLAIPGVKNALRPPKIMPPSAEALSSAGGAGYDKARGMGVEYSSAAVASAAEDLRRNLEADGILAELAPKTHSILKGLTSPPPNSTAPLAGLEAARRALGHAGKDFANPTEQLASRRVSDWIDEFVSSPDSTSVVAGPAAAAAATIKDARGNYAAAKRSEQLTGVEDAAELRSAAANSGHNLGNSLRSKVASVLLDPKKRAGYSAEEIAALEQVVKGTASRNTLRRVGNLLGGGGGLGAIVTGAAGALLGGHEAGMYGASAGAAALPAAGLAARAGENALTRRALKAVDERVRRRSPLYSQMQVGAPMSVPSIEGRAALMRSLLIQPQNRRKDGGPR